jgi:hypothetical protein
MATFRKPRIVGGMYWSFVTPAYAPPWARTACRSIAKLTAFFSRTLPVPPPPNRRRSWFIAR